MRSGSDQSAVVRYAMPPPMGRRQSPPPWRSALLLTGLYATVGFLYIQFSGSIAQALSSNTAELARIEAVKGTIFVLVTSLALFAGSFCALRRFRVSESELARREERLLHAQGRAVIGDIAASCAHDLANVMAITQSHLELALLKPSEAAEHVERATASLQQAIAITQTVHAQHSARHESLWDAISASKRLIDYHHAVSHCDVAMEVEDWCASVTVDSIAMRRFLLSAVINAAEAGPGMRILITAQRDGSDVVVAVHDGGPGLPAALGREILEPYVSTKDRGSGLGMTAAVACARLHGGRVELGRSSQLGGALVGIRFAPAVSATATG